MRPARGRPEGSVSPGGGSGLAAQVEREARSILAPCPGSPGHQWPSRDLIPAGRCGALRPPRAAVRISFETCSVQQPRQRQCGRAGQGEGTHGAVRLAWDRESLEQVRNTQEGFLEGVAGQLRLAEG